MVGTGSGGPGEWPRRGCQRRTASNSNSYHVRSTEYRVHGTNKRKEGEIRDAKSQVVLTGGFSNNGLRRAPGDSRGQDGGTEGSAIGQSRRQRSGRRRGAAQKGPPSPAEETSTAYSHPPCGCPSGLCNSLLASRQRLRQAADPRQLPHGPWAAAGLQPQKWLTS